MGDAFVVRRGGGSSKLFAAVGVIYPTDDACTCSNGKKTLTAKGVNGRWVFPIPEEGTWMVVAGDKIKEVSIEHPGQCELVNLAALYLFKEGAGVQSDWTALFGGFTNASVSSSKMELSGGSSAYMSMCAAVTSANAISLKGYSKLVFDVETSLANTAWIGVSKKKFVWNETQTTISRNNSERYTDLKSIERKEVSVDISGLDDDFYVFVASDGMNVITKVYNIWLE